MSDGRKVTAQPARDVTIGSQSPRETCPCPWAEGAKCLPGLQGPPWRPPPPGSLVPPSSLKSAPLQPPLTSAHGGLQHPGGVACPSHISLRRLPKSSSLETSTSQGLTGQQAVGVLSVATLGTELAVLGFFSRRCGAGGGSWALRNGTQLNCGIDRTFGPLKCTSWEIGISHVQILPQCTCVSVLSPRPSVSHFPQPLDFHMASPFPPTPRFVQAPPASSLPYPEKPFLYTQPNKDALWCPPDAGTPRSEGIPVPQCSQEGGRPSPARQPSSCQVTTSKCGAGRH